MAMAKRWIVSRPIHADTTYDRIVDTGKRIFKVQIKSVRAKNSAGKYVVYLRRKNNKTYHKDDVDIFAGYILEEDTWLIAPNDGRVTMSNTTDGCTENWELFETL